MSEKEILEIVYNYVKTHCTDDIAAHDWWHIYRVYNTARVINQHEKANEFVVLMIALLHDVFDWKFHPDVNISDEIIKLLQKLNIKEYINQNDLNNVCHSVSNISFKGGFEIVELSKEGQITQDADRIDNIGAIGMARTFAYGGEINRPLYDPDQGIIEIKNEEEYKNLQRHSINHFYEKLLKLKDLMNTETGKIIANKRHAFMEEYLKHFFEEWEAKDIE